MGGSAKECDSSCFYNNTNKTVLQHYASVYRTRSGWKDTWQSGCGIETKEEYDGLNNKMLNSVKTYGGFWLGRYEAGTADKSIRTTNSEPTTVNAISAQDQYVYNYVTIAQAQELCNRNSNGDYSVSLLFGIQWDLICKYLESKGVAQTTITTDSTSIGNYNNAIFAITRGKYSTNVGESYTNVSGSYTKPDSSQVLLTTGASERNKTMNIYDLAGNQYEWTLEKANSDLYPGVNRGGRYNLSGADYPLAYRDCFAMHVSNNTLSFRQTLYK